VTATAEPALRSAVALEGVTVRVQGAGGPRELLHDVSVTIAPGEHWAVLGRNGAGKTTLLQVLAGVRRPTTGSVVVLGRAVGSPGMRDPRAHLGVVEALPGALAGGMRPPDVVLHGARGSVASQGSRVTEAERARSVALLLRMGCGELLDARFADLSRGERQRVLIARALMRRPRVLLLDEPATGLDLPAREALLHGLADLAAEDPQLATVTITHHVEELPPSTTHALLLRDGAVTARGPVRETLTAPALTACLGVAVSVDRIAGRWTARSAERARW
jgi:iron complex transport system ATP-binding protein